ncbi:peptidase M23B [Psychromonas sp. CNPT3]|uniref:murein hydrolase activator EnvC family protein n=1 Tax=Psychromonas sp. CNPT3 TaxID=314282 RepID=UPI00006E38F3|nr:peptidoglycan DD-metalloendopeptidase family protein [Psychromonas sp. CNPT3]AGH82232.1 peptidase M23B [Psychromonas sp. CNPT3]
MIDQYPKQPFGKKRQAYKSLFLFLLLLFPVSTSWASNDLSRLQQKITKTTQQSLKQKQQQQRLEDQVASAEKRTASAALIERKTQKKLIKKKRHLRDLQKNIQKLEKDTKTQQKLLQKLLLSAYMSGQHDFIKLLLNQENISKITRAKTYYQYLNEARLESLHTLQKTQEQLIDNRADVTQSLNDLYALDKQQKKTKKTLLQQKNKRQFALNKLNKDLNYQRSQLAKLNGAERALKTKLKKEKIIRQKTQARIQARIQANKEKERERAKNKRKKQLPIDQLKGKLKWPIKGKVLAHFGSKRSAKIRWKGILISANEGEKVKAVASGRVLFAGYFKGYGMVIALEHGDDHITLYAYNQALLYKTGETVFAGDNIALAGHSGGQERNSLYFELTYKGKAQNPLRWLQK